MSVKHNIEIAMRLSSTEDDGWSITKKEVNDTCSNIETLIKNASLAERIEIQKNIIAIQKSLDNIEYNLRKANMLVGKFIEEEK